MTRRATANILVTLPNHIARRRLLTLATRADVLALQEWPRHRNILLDNLGRLQHGPVLRDLPARRGGWTFARPRIGGGPIGVHVNLGERVLSVKAKMLTGPGRVDRVVGRRTTLGPSWATRLKSRRADGSVVVRYNIHLTAGIQAGRNGYRTDRPKRVARHKAERAKLTRLVTRDLARGHDVEVYGDTNFHHMPIPGLVGWWTLEPDAGTLGTRAIDGIWTSTRPESVAFLSALVPGEHRHVITGSARPTRATPHASPRRA